MSPTHCTKQTNWENNVLQEMITKKHFSEMEGKKVTEKVLHFVTESIYNALSSTKTHHNPHQNGITIIYSHIGKLRN